MSRNFFVKNGYRSIRLILSSKGDYSQKDSEWNYSDIPHLNYIHSRVEGITLKASRTHISNIFLQRVGPFEIPASVNISHLTAGKHEYIMTILNIGISVVTSHKNDSDGCLTTTTYEFFYKDLAGFIMCLLARMTTRKNYRILMSEDMPMRIQRGILRRKGIGFKLDTLDLIGFTDTLDISCNNIECGSALQANEEFRIEVTGLSGSIDTANDLLRVEWRDNNLLIVPKICPHEGAPLAHKQTHMHSADHLHDCLLCPWHGRKIGPVARMNLLDEEKLDFCIYHRQFSIKKTKCALDKQSGLSYEITLRLKGPEIRCKPLQKNDKRYDCELDSNETRINHKGDSG
jgi:hypothetical protein